MTTKLVLVSHISRILWSLAQAQSASVGINTLAFTVMVVHPSYFRHLYDAAHPPFLLLLMRAFMIPLTMSCAIALHDAAVTLCLVAFIEQLDLLLSWVAACRCLVAPGTSQMSPFDIDSEDVA
ncbi:hypothetical protein BDW75DRAFT_235333 [Aspergillus navahoensis]